MPMKAKAEKDLREILNTVGLPVRGSYRPGEVQKILGISERELQRIIARYERDQVSGALKHPCSLDSFMLGQNRRIRFNELVDFLCRNNSQERIFG